MNTSVSLPAPQRVNWLYVSIMLEWLIKATSILLVTTLINV